MSWVQGCGVYLPETRLDMAELTRFHGLGGKPACQRLAVPDLDEDALTMGFEAASRALAAAGLEGGQVQALVWGSLSPPFSMKPVAPLLAQALGLPADAITLGLGSSPKLAGEAILAARGLLGSGACQRCLVVCADCLPLPGRDALTLPISAGAAALVMSDSGGFARLTHWASHHGEVYDLWRLAEEARPRWDQAAYAQGFAQAAAEALAALGQKAGLNPHELDRLVLAAPNPRLAGKLAKGLGLPSVAEASRTAQAGWLLSGSLLFDLAEAFGQAKQGQRIAALACGGGSADALLWEMERPAGRAAPNGEAMQAIWETCTPIGVARYQQAAGQ